MATWFGLRTIFDSGARFPRDGGPWLAKEVKKDVEELLKRLPRDRPPVIYATTRGTSLAIDITTGLASQQTTRVKPIMVYETGTRGDFKAENKVGKLENCSVAVAASALDALTLLEAVRSSRTRLTVEDLMAERQNILNQIEGRGSKSTLDEDREPPDETGRSWTLHRLARAIKSLPAAQLAKALRDDWPSVEVYCITLGEAGWAVLPLADKRSDKWLWARLDPTNALPLWETRNGLGCGDISRAAFAISIVAQTAKGHTPDAEMWKVAAAWAVWLGWQKLRYFKLANFLQWIQETCGNEDEPWDLAAWPPPVMVGGKQVQTQVTSITRKQLGDAITKRVPPREEVHMMAQKWREERLKDGGCDV